VVGGPALDGTNDSFVASVRTNESFVPKARRPGGLKVREPGRPDQLVSMVGE
jgi:hypothetical protein